MRLSETSSSMMRLRLLIFSAASFLSKPALLVAVALCFLIKLCVIAYRTAMDSVASGVYGRFLQAAEDDAHAEMLYYEALQGPDRGCETESMCALRDCVRDAEVSSCSSAEDEGTAEMTCVVCLGVMRREEEVGQLQRCRHVFHRACIHAWLRRCCHRCSPATCPICRARLISQ